MIFLDSYCAESGDPADIVSAKVDQHVVFGKFLLIRQKLPLQSRVLLRRLSARPRPGQRKCVQYAVLKLYQSLRRGARRLHIRPGEVEHVRRRIQGSKHPVAVQKAALVVRLQTVAEHNLKNIALMNMMLRLPHHAAVLLPVKHRPHLRPQDARRLLLCLSGQDEVCHLPQLPLRLAVCGLRLRQIDVDDQNDLLRHIVERDDPVEQHQVHILELLAVLRVEMQRRFRILQKIVGKVADQAAGERREVIHPRRAVLIQNIPDIRRRIVRFKGKISHRHPPVQAGDLQLRIISEKGVSAPLLLRLRGLQNVRVRRHILQLPQHLNRRRDISEDLRAHRIPAVRPAPAAFLRGELHHFLYGRPDSKLHPGTSCRAPRGIRTGEAGWTILWMNFPG